RRDLRGLRNSIGTPRQTERKYRRCNTQRDGAALSPGAHSGCSVQSQTCTCAGVVCVSRVNSHWHVPDALEQLARYFGRSTTVTPASSVQPVGCASSILILHSPATAIA